MVILLLIDNHINIDDCLIRTDVLLTDRCLSENFFDLTDRENNNERKKKNANHGFFPR